MIDWLDLLIANRFRFTMFNLIDVILVKRVNASSLEPPRAYPLSAGSPIENSITSSLPGVFWVI